RKPIHNRRNYQWLTPIITQRNEPLNISQQSIVVRSKPCTSRVKRYRLSLMKLAAISQQSRESLNAVASHRDDRIYPNTLSISLTPVKPSMKRIVLDVGQSISS